MQKKLRKKKSAHVIALSENLKIRTAPAVAAGILIAVVSAVLVALIYTLYMFLVDKSPAVGVAVPVILYILLVMAGSYVAANYFDTRSLVPSASVGGLFLLMSLTYTISAYGFAELGGATVPLKLLFTLIGIFLGYFLVDIVYLPWLPIREHNDSYFVEDEYDDDYRSDAAENNYNDYNVTSDYNNFGGYGSDNNSQDSENQYNNSNSNFFNQY
ncbi:MAG: hypothetical protein ACOX7J_04890 [Bacillota bacterium]|jgi:hypothetical protein